MALVELRYHQKEAANFMVSARTWRNQKKQKQKPKWQIMSFRFIDYLLSANRAV